MTRQAVQVRRITEARLCNHCSSGKAIIITYSEWVFVALVIQHVMCLPIVVLSYLVCLVLPHFFPYYFIKAIIFYEGDFEYKMRVLFFSTHFVPNISYRKKN
jgi:hypothetical protein